MKQSKYLLDSVNFMIEAAQKMETVATENCSAELIAAAPMKNRGDAPECQWYHAAWGYCRVLGFIPTPNLHEQYYKQLFETKLNSDSVNILISGTADFSILEHILQALPQALYDKTTIYVLDMCLTPLKMCSWYNEKRLQCGGEPIKIIYLQRDALHTQLPNEHVDLITTYSFLARFDADKQNVLIDEWRRILKPDGMIITADRITPQYEEEFYEDSSDQTDSFIEIAKQRIKNFPQLADREEQIFSLLRRYSLHRLHYSFRNLDMYTALFNLFNYNITMHDVVDILETKKSYAVIRASKK